MIEEVSQGSEQAFKVLFERHRHRLHQYISKIIKSEEVAKELVMDVFLKLWLGRDVMVQIENFDAFLFRVAYNKSIDFLRAAAKDKVFSELLWQKIQLPAEASADTALLLQEYEARLREAIDLLPPQRKRILYLSREEGLSHAEIAERLGISKSTVANTIVEARQFIKAYLSKHLHMVVWMTVFSTLLKNK